MTSVMSSWQEQPQTFLDCTLVESEALHHFFHLGGVEFCLMLRVAHADNTGCIIS